MRCTAKSKQTGERCKNEAVEGKLVCRFHGGLSKGGIESASLKIGRYSKYLPEKLLERYHESQNDRELLALREEIALLDTRLSDLITRIDSGESGALWGKARALMSQYNEAVQMGDPAQMQAKIHALRALIEKGMGDYAIWSEIRDVVDDRRKLVESERRRLVDMQQMIRAEDATLLVMRIIDIIKTGVTSKQDRAKVTRELLGLLDLADVGNVGTGSFNPYKKEKPTKSEVVDS